MTLQFGQESDFFSDSSGSQFTSTLPLPPICPSGVVDSIGGCGSPVNFNEPEVLFSKTDKIRNDENMFRVLVWVGIIFIIYKIVS